VSSGASLGWDASTALLLAFTGLGVVAVLGGAAAHRLPRSLPADRNRPV
jgi:hypothetical protein